MSSHFNFIYIYIFAFVFGINFQLSTIIWNLMQKVNNPILPWPKHMLWADVKVLFAQFCRSECSRVLETSWKTYSRAVRLNMKLILVKQLEWGSIFLKGEVMGAGCLAMFSPGFFPSLFAADLRSHLLLRNCFFFVQSHSFCHFPLPLRGPLSLQIKNTICRHCDPVGRECT